MRLQARRLGIAIARRDRRRQQQTQFVALPRQHQRVAVANDGALTGHQVADTGGVKAWASFLQQDGAVAVGHRFFVVALSPLALNHLAEEFLAGNLKLKAQQHGTDGQREGVDGLDVGVLRIHIGLLDLDLGDKFVQAGPNLDFLERNLSAIAVHQDGAVFFSCCHGLGLF